MALASSPSPTAQPTKATSSKTTSAATAALPGLMGRFTMATGLKARCMALGLSHGPMAARTKDNLPTITAKVKERTRGLTGRNMKVAGSVASITEVAPFHRLMGRLFAPSGKKARRSRSTSIKSEKNDSSLIYI